MHGFRLKGPLFADPEYGLGSGRSTDLRRERAVGGEVGREQRLVELGEEVGQRSELSIGPGLDK